MDPALGPPQAMAEQRDELTPMMAQYHDLCAAYDDALVLFQVGDFYETFCGAAERTARLLELTLTSREDSTGEYPMTGVPIDNVEPYVEELLEHGYRVAIADQVQDPSEATGVVDRAVTRIITPGTLTEDELLSSDDNTFVAALARGHDRQETLALALLDVSTGDFLTTSAPRGARIADELTRFTPAEAILEPGVDADVLPERCMVTAFDSIAFDLENARERLKTYFGQPETLVANDAEIRACGAVLAYAEYTRGGLPEGEDGPGESDGPDPATIPETSRLEYVTRLHRYDPREYLLLDAVAVNSLELFEPRAVHGRRDATLVGILDETETALGGRRLRDWVRRPLLDPTDIDARLDAVEWLINDPQTRDAIRDDLRGVYDLERLIGRISRERANARDLRSLHDTLTRVPAIRDALEGVENSALLEDLHDALDPLEDVREHIDRAVVADPPHELTEGGIIADGYDDHLDELRDTAREGKQWIDDLEEHERERTGVDSLKVGYNSVHGYYIEVTNPNLEAVPEDYQRRQTLKRAERFVTPELKQREEEIVGAESRADQHEYERFREVRRSIADEVERVQTLADALARLDALCSLATVAAEHDYCRPTLLEDADAPRLEIRGGRHPVVERTQSSFVPNDAALNQDARVALITGPNMSGKSTYMRQVALIVLLTQLGSFVPAREVRLSPLERIFTRVGASDDIAGGRSTFMVEMDELATILREADDHSLVLLDEVGRGTATSDGLALAQAITEHIHDRVGALTLFATHHHPLTALESDLEGAFTRHFEASKVDGEVCFDHDIRPGPATGSYGVDVATAAGVPAPIVDRARDLLEEGEGSGSESVSSGGTDQQRRGADEQTAMSADGGDDATDIAAELRALEVAQLTPVEALTELDRLKRALERPDDD